VGHAVLLFLRGSYKGLKHGYSQENRLEESIASKQAGPTRTTMEVKDPADNIAQGPWV